MCLVLALKRGLVARAIAEMLSQWRTGAETENPRSWSKYVNHFTYEADCAMALYSIAVKDLATVCCFLEDQDT